MRNVRSGVGLLGLTAFAISAAAFAAEPAFRNCGTLAGFTGANQKAKVAETREQDSDGNGTSLKCLMVRNEADTPTGGCHAEAHLSRFADGSRLGAHPGFESATEYRVRFDTNCNAAAVGFFQYKNCGGPDRWKYLVALWRSSGKNGSEILFQANPSGKSAHRYAKLAPQQALVAERWHTVRVEGRFTCDATAWCEVTVNGLQVEWFADPERRQPLGARLTGPFLPDLPGSEWQLQLGGYGFFKDRHTQAATVFVDAVAVWSGPQRPCSDK